MFQKEISFCTLITLNDGLLTGQEMIQILFYPAKSQLGHIRSKQNLILSETLWHNEHARHTYSIYEKLTLTISVVIWLK